MSCAKLEWTPLPLSDFIILGFYFAPINPYIKAEYGENKTNFFPFRVLTLCCVAVYILRCGHCYSKYAKIIYTYIHKFDRARWGLVDVLPPIVKPSRQSWI